MQLRVERSAVVQDRGAIGKVRRGIAGIICFVGAAACSDFVASVAPPAEEPQQARFLSVVPAVDADGVAPLAAFYFRLPPGAEADDLRLFQGELTPRQLGALRKGPPSQALLERQVPTFAWPYWKLPDMDGGAVEGEWQAIVSAPLDLGMVHSWVYGPTGPLLVFAVGQTPAVVVPRWWPPEEAPYSGYAAYCGERAAELEQDWVTLAPGRERARLLPGLGFGLEPDSACVHLRYPVEYEVRAAIVDAAEGSAPGLDPGPFALGTSASDSSMVCEEPATPLGPGCATVADDRLSLETRGEWLWRLRIGAKTRVERSGTGRAFTIRGLPEQSELQFDFLALGAYGARFEGQGAFTTSLSVPHLVINEVLSNPLGLEPHQEWVELYNDGSTAVRILGWTFSDGQAVTPLPDVSIPPGAFALLVSESYEVGTGLDVPVPDGAMVMRLARLGQAGLSNTGEPLTLMDADGVVRSRVPALAASKAGISIARTRPDSRDQAGSFVPHPPPGASPGRHNGSELVE